mmetsp:Transcript_6134/g.9019  ORF Transcript_6134/g.9019 Transcript_6134/m.9019 type:complete len:97 (-) Transcript_6134:55-345(-)
MLHSPEEGSGDMDRNMVELGLTGSDESFGATFVALPPLAATVPLEGAFGVAVKSRLASSRKEADAPRKSGEWRLGTGIFKDGNVMNKDTMSRYGTL